MNDNLITGYMFFIWLIQLTAVAFSEKIGGIYGDVLADFGTLMFLLIALAFVGSVANRAMENSIIKSKEVKEHDKYK